MRRLNVDVKVVNGQQGYKSFDWLDDIVNLEAFVRTATREAQDGTARLTFSTDQSAIHAQLRQEDLAILDDWVRSSEFDTNTRPLTGVGESSLADSSRVLGVRRLRRQFIERPAHGPR